MWEGVGYSGPMSGGVPPTMWLIPWCILPPPDPLWTEWLTDACENMTFPQLLLRVVKIPRNPWRLCWVALPISGFASCGSLYKLKNNCRCPNVLKNLLFLDKLAKHCEIFGTKDYEAETLTVYKIHAVLAVVDPERTQFFAVHNLGVKRTVLNVMDPLLKYEIFSMWT